MIKSVTPSSANQTVNGNVRFSAASTSTSAYLSGHVGKVVVGTVLNVIDGTPTTRQTGQQSSSVLNADSANYRVEINVQGQKLSLESAVAPRTGQQLELQVLDARTVKILLASTNTTRGKEVATGSTQGSPAAREAVPGAQQASVTTARTPTLGAASLVSVIQSALRQSLPLAIESGEFVRLGERLTTIAALPSNRPSDSPGQNVAQLARVLAAVVIPLDNRSTSTVAQATTNARLSGASVSPTVSGEPNKSLATGVTATQSATIQSTGTPQASAPAITEQTLRTLLNQIQIESPTRFNQLQNAVLQLQQAAQTFATNALSTAALTDVGQLAEAVKNSGIFYEAKLLQRLQALNSRPSSAAAGDNNSRVAITPQDIDTVRADTAIARDAKYNALTLAQSLARLLQLLDPKQALSGQANPATSGSSALPPANNIDNIILTNFWPLLNALQQHPTTSTENSAKPDFSDAILTLIKQVLATLARTQSQQWFNLGSQIASNETPVPQNWAFVIPLFHQGQQHAIDVQIDREREQQRSDKEINERWALRLRFDLEEYGELTALATLRQKTVTAVFWAEKSQLATRLESELQQLKSTLTRAGLDVAHLLSRVGQLPTAKKSSTSQLIAESLIDDSI